jgi:hypothetical protein
MITLGGKCYLLPRNKSVFFLFILYFIRGMEVKEEL